MKRNKTKRRIIALIVAAALFASGIVLAALGGVFMGKNSHLISRANYKSVRIDVTDEFKSINVSATTAGVIFEASEDGSSYVLTHLPEKLDTQVYVEDGVLHVNSKDNRKWYEHIAISIDNDSPSIAIYMPKGEYEALDVNVTTGDVRTAKEHSFASLSIEATTGDMVISSPVKESLYAKVTTSNVNIDNVSPALMEIKATTGDIKIENAQNAGKIIAGTSTGKVKLSSVRAEDIDIETTTADVILDDVITESVAHIKATSGDVKFTEIDAAEIYIKVTTGDVKGTLLSGKIFTTDTTTGDVRVPYSTEGGVCDIKTTTGDIIITITNP